LSQAGTYSGPPLSNLRGDEVNEEDLKLLAEFLGVHIEFVMGIFCLCDGKKYPNRWNWGFADWLLSPEGQSAIMDRLDQAGIIVHTSPRTKHYEWFLCGLGEHGRPFQSEREIVAGEPGKTRPEALIAATLEMLRKDKV
jgi:hypothetical protein